jgi:serine/threonine-protein kinase HipA
MGSPKTLTVWLHDEPVGTVSSERGKIRLVYSPETLDRHLGNVPLLSCSLLTGKGRLDATAFVDGLLPEGEHRRGLAQRAKLASHDTFGLIARYGRDIAGAVQFTDPDSEPHRRDRWQLRPLGTDDLDQVIGNLADNPLGVTDESELSIDGMQNKTVLVRMPDGTWAQPLYGHPSSHIIKRSPDRYPTLVDAEHAALTVARHAGLTTVNSWVDTVAAHRCLIVERFDRTFNDAGEITGRIHQEDACQALGIPASCKYEVHHGGGGPDFESVARLLDLYTADPISQLERLASTAAFTVIIGNADAHGKNTAFLLEDGVIRLASLYDTVPTALFPPLRTEMAMTLGGTVSSDGMNLAALVRETQRWNLDPVRARATATKTAELALQAVDEALIDPDGPLAAQIRRKATEFMD